MRQPVSPVSAASTTAWISPPSDRSCAADTSPSRDAAASTSASSFSRARSTFGGTPPRWSAVTCAQIDPSNSSRVSPSRISVSPGSVPKTGRDAPFHVVDHTEHADDRGRQDRRGPGLVVEADVAAGDRNAKGRTAVGEPAHGLAELPHDAGVLRRAEVQAVGDGDGRGTGDRDVAIRLGKRELRAGVRVEQRVAAGRVGRDRDAAAGVFVDAQHAAVGVLCQHRVAAHVAVVLFGDEGAAAQMRTAKQRKQSRAQLVTG